MLARDTNKYLQSTENKGKTQKKFKIEPFVLARDTYNFKNVYSTKTNDDDYIYETELIVLKDFRSNSIIFDTPEFKEFVTKETQREKDKKFDYDYNIRDLYPLTIHTNNKRKEDIQSFNKINNYILNSSRISRRVTKKEIVYKKDKALSIVSVMICKNGYLKVFLRETITDFDLYNKFVTIPKGNCKPMKKMMKIYNGEDLKYLELILDKYIEKVL